MKFVLKQCDTELLSFNLRPKNSLDCSFCTHPRVLFTFGRNYNPPAWQMKKWKRFCKRGASFFFEIRKQTRMTIHIDNEYFSV